MRQTKEPQNWCETILFTRIFPIPDVRVQRRYRVRVALFLIGIVLLFLDSHAAVNKFWLKNQQLEGLGKRFFYPTGPMTERGKEADTDKDWKTMRDRWEYSHLVRAALSVIALVTLTVALSMRR